MLVESSAEIREGRDCDVLVEPSADCNTGSCDATCVVLAPADGDVSSWETSWELCASDVIKLSVATSRVDVGKLWQAAAVARMDGVESSLVAGASAAEDEVVVPLVGPSVQPSPPFAPMVLGASAIELISRGHESAHGCVIRRLARVVPGERLLILREHAKVGGRRASDSAPTFHGVTLQQQQISSRNLHHSSQFSSNVHVVRMYPRVHQHIV